MTSIVIPLRCSIKQYHWGKHGSSSVVGALGKMSGSIKSLDENSTYAELWMGTHPSGPSYAVAPDGEEILLSELLKQSPEYSGTMSVIAKYGSDLPFLFKVLSINEPLSIQSHPNKELAKELHAKDPENYPDENHKPEMAIALTEMELLCSFRPHEQILESIMNHSELSSIVQEERFNNYLNASNESSRKSCLKDCFKSIIEADDEKVEKAVESLVQKFSGQSSQTNLQSSQTDLQSSQTNLQSSQTNLQSSQTDLQQLFLRLAQKYPGDVGCLCIFFLNYIKLGPFQAVFLAANEPHSYISGDCVECMAQSDNVIRAGFTPKFKDKSVLVSSLTYNSIPISGLLLQPKSQGTENNLQPKSQGTENNLLLPKSQGTENNLLLPKSQGRESDGYIEVYDPPVDEFCVEKIEVKDVEIGSKVTLGRKCSGSILIMIAGSVKVENTQQQLVQGSVHFIPASLTIHLVNGTSYVLAFRAFVKT